MKESLIEYSILFLSIIIVLLGTIMLTIAAANQPIVFVSYTTGECVSVINPDDSIGACSDINLITDKYDRRWVK